MSDQPELGQIMFGNPTGAYGTEEWVDALVEALLYDIERVYWNQQQEQWNRYEDIKMEGVEFRPYYWGDNEEEAAKPNLKFDFSEQAIRWYKHPGRGQSSELKFTPEEWIEWFNKGMAVIRGNDKDLF